MKTLFKLFLIFIGFIFIIGWLGSDSEPSEIEPNPMLAYNYAEDFVK